MELEDLKKRMINKAQQEHLLLGILPGVIDYEVCFEVPRTQVIEALTELKDAFSTRFGIDIYEVYLEKPKLVQSENGFELDFGETFSEKLKVVKKSGLKQPAGYEENSNDLPGKFLLACNIILQTTDKRSTAAKLKAVGVSPAQWDGYLKNLELREWFESRLNETFQQAENSAKVSLMRNIEAGDLPSIKHYQEYTGRYRPNAEFTMNLGIIIARLMEILSSKLPPEVLMEVAEEIEELTRPTQELTA